MSWFCFLTIYSETRLVLWRWLNLGSHQNQNNDLVTSRLFGRWSQETPVGDITSEDTWGSVLVGTLLETVLSHRWVRKLGYLSLKSHLALVEDHSRVVNPSGFLDCSYRVLTWCQRTSSGRDVGSHGMDENYPWRPPRWYQQCLLQGKGCGRRVYQILLRRSQYVGHGWRYLMFEVRHEWEGLNISTSGCLNISTYKCLNWSCGMSPFFSMGKSQHLNLGMSQHWNLWISLHLTVQMSQHFVMWMSQHLNLHVSTSQCTNVITSEPKNISTYECLNISACKYRNVWTCDYLNILICKHFHIWTCEYLNISACKFFNISTCDCLNISACKSHNWSCVVLNISTCSLNLRLSHLNMQMSWHLKVWLSTSQHMDLNMTIHECCNIMTPKSWVSHYLPSKPQPSEHQWDTSTQKFYLLSKFCSCTQLSTGSYRWRDTCSSFATIH